VRSLTNAFVNSKTTRLGDRLIGHTVARQFHFLSRYLAEGHATRILKIGPGQGEFACQLWFVFCNGPDLMDGRDDV